MKKFFVKFVSSLSLLSICFQLTVFAQRDISPEPIKYGDKPIFIQSSLGPFGEVYLPPSVIANATNYSLSGKEKLSFKADEYFFPSIYFTISAKPHIDIKSKDKREKDEKNPDYEFTKKGENLNWMRVTTDIEATPCKCDGCLDSTEVKIIGVSPEETKTSLKENPLAQLGVVGDALVNKLLPFTFAEEHPDTQNASAEYSAISGAVSILFTNLFPAKAIAKNYAFIDGEVSLKKDITNNKFEIDPKALEEIKNLEKELKEFNDKKDIKNSEETSKKLEKYKKLNRFGWFWQRIDDKTTPESIIGVRRGTVFLQIARGVQSITVRHTIHAKYDSDYSEKIDDEYVDVIKEAKDFTFDNSNCFPQPNPKSLYEKTNYAFLNNLDDFPLLIPQEVVCKIFRQDIGSIDYRPNDIVDTIKLLQNFENSSNNTISNKIWGIIGKRVKKRLNITDEKIKKKANLFSSLAQENAKISKRSETQEYNLLLFKAKVVFAEEINRIFDDEDFYEFIKIKIGGNTLDSLKSQGNLKELQIAIRNKIETEITSELLKKYEVKSQCDKWFDSNPKPFTEIVKGKNDEQFVRREEVKAKLEIPTLKEMLKKTQIEINQKP